MGLGSSWGAERAKSRAEPGGREGERWDEEEFYHFIIERTDCDVLESRFVRMGL